ncbi:MAG: helix-turn-helix transcriptional regulator [Anaerococcus sp.]|nr:helix-turn-helix transcriptional regulator [Anaerococcus sp.]
MILADKLIYLRKSFNMTQEDLAYKMGVSRQAISKWESSMSVPELERIIKLSEIFSITTDFLLNDKMEIEDLKGQYTDSFQGKKLDMDFANNYLIAYNKFAKNIGLAVFVFIFGVSLYSILESLNQRIFNILASPFLLAFISLGVVICIKAITNISKYDLIEEEDYELSYGVRGLIENEEEAFARRHSKNLILGVALILVSMIPYLVFDGIYRENIPENLDGLLVGLMLFMIALGSGLLTYTSTRKSSYKKIIENEDLLTLKKNKRNDKIFAIFWIGVTGTYFLISFVFNLWSISWLIWPLAFLISIILAIIFEASK